mgnify:CR=1 FL=1
MDEEIQRFISIFDPNKRIDFTKVLTNDITRSEYAVLWMYKNMAQNSGVVYVSDIVKKFPASAQALSKHLRTCENKGYIERVNDKVNRRNVMINLTDKGEKVFEITTQEFVLLKNKVFEKIDIDEFREAIKKMFEFREVLSATIDELRKKTGGFFGSGESTGSVGVVTINMPRIAYQAEDENDFMLRLDRMMDISARSLKIKRDVISKLLEEGLYPYTKRYLGSFDNHFSTIGLVGMNEAGLNARWLKCDMTDVRTQEFTKRVLNHMRERLVMYQEEYGDLYNLEATPAESTAYRLAKHDRERWSDIRTAGKEGDTPYYTNSSHLPVEYTSDIFDALDVQDELQTLYTSGTVFHAFLGEKLPDWKAAASLVRKIAENYKLPYYTLSPTYSVCKTHGYIAGEHFICPKCGEKAEVYSRITGYYRPVQNWNDGKSQEYKNRTVYDILHSNLKAKPAEQKLEQEQPVKTEQETVVETVKEEKYLFTTATCPNCKIAKKMLEGEEYQVIDADQNPEMVRKFGIMQAPTLVVFDGDKMHKYVNASNIQRYVDQM